MLDKRYQFDGKPIMILNKIQLENKKIVEDKLNSKKIQVRKS